jgi:MFS family permease
VTFEDYVHGIRDNLEQFLHQLFQVLLVGMTLGLMRTVVPALAETEFDVPRGSFILLTAFVVAFGFVKGALNFVAGRLSERYGRKRVLMAGWLIAVPIPFMVYLAPDWNWIVFATVLLGINQGLTWSMTQTSKLDITRPDQRGFTIGMNEFSGYFGVAVAGSPLLRHSSGSKRPFRGRRPRHTDMPREPIPARRQGFPVIFLTRHPHGRCLH